MATEKRNLVASFTASGSWTDESNAYTEDDAFAYTSDLDAISDYGACPFQDITQTPDSLDEFKIKWFDSNADHDNDELQLQVYDNHTSSWSLLETFNAGNQIHTTLTEVEYTSALQTLFAAASDKTAFLNNLQIRLIVTAQTGGKDDPRFSVAWANFTYTLAGTTHPLAGTSSAVSGASGSLEISTELKGTSAASSSVAGELSVETTLAGQSDAVSGASGTLYPTPPSEGYEVTDQIASFEYAGYRFQRKLCRTSNGDLHCVYYRIISSYRQICYAVSTDEGETWNETQLTSASYHQWDPGIAVDSNDILHVVFFGQNASHPSYPQIRYIKYDGSWSGITEITDLSGTQKFPSIAVDSNDYIHLAWQGDDDTYSISQIWYRVYTDSWQATDQLTEDETYDQLTATISIAPNNNVHIFWYGTHSGSTVYFQIRHRVYTDSWQSIENVTSDSISHTDPNCAIDSSGNLHLVYTPGYYDVYTDSWAGPFAVGYDGVYAQIDFNISIDANDNLHVMWEGKHAGSPNKYQVRYRLNNGSWQAIEELTNSDAESRVPNMIWAYHPSVSGARTNRAASGYAFIFAWYDKVVYYWPSSGLAWETRTISLQGQADAQSSATGSLSIGLTLSGQADCVSSVTGALGIDKNLAGQVDASSGASGSLSIETNLAGVSAASSSASGGLEIETQLSGQADAVSGATGSLSIETTLAGSVNATSSATGTLTTSGSVQISLSTDYWNVSFAAAVALAGVVDAVSSASGLLSVLTTLQGQIDAVSSASGTLTTLGTQLLQGQVDAQSGVTGSLSVLTLISGQVDAVSGAAGVLSVETELKGQSDAVSSASGALQVGRRLLGQSDAVSAAQGNVSVLTALSGQADAVSGASGTLSTQGQVALAGQVDAQSGAVGSLEVETTLAGQSDAVASATAALKVKRQLAGTVSAVSGAEGTLTTAADVSLAGTVDAQSGASGSLNIETTLAGMVDAQSGASGTLSTQDQVALAGQVDAQSGVSGNLEVETTLSGQADAVSSATAALKVRRTLAGTASAVSGAEGTLTTAADVSLAGQVDAQSGASGSISVETTLAGTADAQSGASGTLEKTTTLAGSAGVSSSAVGQLSVLTSLAGIVQAASSAEGTLNIVTIGSVRSKVSCSLANQNPLLRGMVA